jgi:uncharacterized protein
MQLAFLPDAFAIVRLAADDPTPAWGTQGALSSVTRTPEELSIVCAADALPAGVQAERPFRCLRIVGRLDLSLTGVLASITVPLAAAKVSIFAISTYDTDYVLVREDSLDAAIACLRTAGHEVLGT